MKRYMGSKRSIIEELFAEISTTEPDARSLLDPFCGAGSVIQRANRRGLRTFAGDLNPVSRELAIAYTQARVDERFSGVLEDPAKDTLTNLRSALALLQDRANSADKEGSQTTGIVYRWWSPAGTKSAYETARGRSDRRNYFTPSNAARLDAALGLVREWWADKRLSRTELALLNAGIIGSAERVANIKGTYGMPARGWQAGVERPLTLMADDDLAGSADPSGIVGDRVDALGFVQDHAGQDVLYLDPPYNFRIYLDYYHIPNFLAQYALLDDPASYAEKFQFARGQNMEDRPGGERGKRFNDPTRFHAALREVIDAARCRTVALSYYDGTNHDNDFDVPDNGKSWAKMLDMLRTLEGYDPRSLRVASIPRQNMQSQRGRKSELVHEYVVTIRRRG